MKLLADECFDARLIEALREGEHDVLAIREHLPGASDQMVLELACAEGRLLLTEDTDFGELVYRLQHPSAGILLLRLPLAPLDLKYDRLDHVLAEPIVREGPVCSD